MKKGKAIKSRENQEIEIAKREKIKMAKCGIGPTVALLLLSG